MKSKEKKIVNVLSPSVEEALAGSYSFTLVSLDASNMISVNSNTGSFFFFFKLNAWSQSRFFGISLC